MLDFLKSNNAVIVIRLCYKAGNCQFHPVAVTSAGVKAQDKRHFHASQKKRAPSQINPGKKIKQAKRTYKISCLFLHELD